MTLDLARLNDLYATWRAASEPGFEGLAQNQFTAAVLAMWPEISARLAPAVVDGVGLEALLERWRVASRQAGLADDVRQDVMQIVAALNQANADRLDLQETREVAAATEARLERAETLLWKLRDRHALLEREENAPSYRALMSQEIAAEIDAALAGTLGEVVHACPPGDVALTPCCGRIVFELPHTDRMTLDASLVTCRGAAQSEEGGR